MRRSLMHTVLVTVLAIALVGCASVTGGPRSTLEPPRDDVVATATETDRSATETRATETPATETPATETPATETPVIETPASEADTAILPVADYQLVREEEAPSTAALLLAQQTQTDPTLSAAPGDAVDEEYDPWESFNERMFEFNRRLDRYILKPVAKAYNAVIPDRVQVMISNGFDNIQFVPRLMNSLFQGKFDGAAREFGRFLFNSTIGIGGLFDVAKIEGIEKSREDFGQTLGFYGVGPGPYIIVPFLEPLTVRDGIGKAVDGFMDPLSYFVPFFYTRLLMKVEEIVNDRSLNLELFQGFEESVIDMYSAARHGYLKRREKLIRE